MSLRLLMLVFAFGMTFTGCKKDEGNEPDNKPEDITIPIDDNSAFNMKNFIISYDQMFVAGSRWAWSFTHEYIDGKAVTSSQNYKIYGDFGVNVLTTTHNYSSDGIITSSDRTSTMYVDEQISFTYEYNLSGFIVKLTKKEKGEIRDIVNFEYSGNSLMKKTHEKIEEGRDAKEESFTYDSDGNVKSYTREYLDSDNETRYYTFTYSNGNMIESKSYYDGDIDRTITYDYDSNNRIIKYSNNYENEDYDGYSTYEYSSDLMTESSYRDNRLTRKSQFKKGHIQVKSWRYIYDDKDDFEYCMVKEHEGDDYGYHNVVKKSYYEGSVSNLDLVGYATVDSRDSESNLKTKESVYSSNGSKLYYVEHVISHDEENDYYYITESKWFLANGTSIDRSQITEEWVSVLVRQ